jgi:hypothetical protein
MFAQETNVFDEKTKTKISFGKHYWTGGGKCKASEVLLNLLTCSVHARSRIL